MPGLHRVGNGWLVACTPCAWEQFANSRTTAERVAREHNRDRHPVTEQTTGESAGLFDLEETR